MNKQQQEDLKRQEELKLKVWGITARNILTNKPHPNEIKTIKIEYNKGRIEKALRLLSDNVEYSRTETKTTLYKVTTLDKSQYAEKKPEFTYDLPGVHDVLFPVDPNTQFDMDTVCYLFVDALDYDSAIYVYWHKDEYDIITDKYNHAWIYPKALLDTRMKAIMRSLVEQHLHTFFHHRLEEHLGLAEGALKTEDMFLPKVRNFAAHSHRFSLEKYFGKGGFIEEYTHFRQYFDALIKQLNEFQLRIVEAGGQDAILMKFRKDIIKLLLRKAPLSAFQKSEVRSYHDDFTMDVQFNNPFLNAFILRNAQYLDYDTLYSDDTEILYINLEGRCTGRIRGAETFCDTPFTPAQDELALIKGMVSCTPPTI